MINDKDIKLPYPVTERLEIQKFKFPDRQTSVAEKILLVYSIPKGNDNIVYKPA